MRRYLSNIDPPVFTRASGILPFALLVYDRGYSYLIAYSSFDPVISSSMTTHCDLSKI